jgi:uncharacterized protein
MDANAIGYALLGGVLIGGAASALLLLNGRIAGISGIAGGIVTPRRGETEWRVVFFAGLLVGGVLLAVVQPQVFGRSPASLGVLALAGLLVGVGTRVSNGCTSGHGVCGLARRSVRSLAATVTFMACAAATVFVVGHVLPRVAP